ncbi:MAG: hypothetical protein HY049_15455 [Acidobacteria bacterium]|nr:hypothetical protein [Acidobacteriota bacterium]
MLPASDLPPHQKRTIREWRASLLAAVSGLFLFESLSGFLIWLAPFSVTNQFMVLVHTAAGVAFAAPFLWYTVRHYLLVRGQPMNHVKLIGWSSALAMLACAASGAVVTWQAAFGTRLGYAWDQVHLVSSIASLVFVGLHAGVLIARNRRVSDAIRALYRRAQLRAGAAVMAWAAAAVVAAVVPAALYRAPDLSWRLPADYSYKYGPNPFAPSLARTSTGGALHPKSLSGSASCGRSGCHEQIYDEWLPSAHRYASMDPAFQVVQGVMAKNEGAESTRYCGGCHDPIALFSGMKNIYTDDLSFEGAQEGVSCVSSPFSRPVAERRGPRPGSSPRRSGNSSRTGRASSPSRRGTCARARGPGA